MSVPVWPNPSTRLGYQTSSTKWRRWSGNPSGAFRSIPESEPDGPSSFPTESFDATGEHLQNKGQEFGATTGRKRRCGWFDAVVVRHAFRINGIKRFALTKLDVLDGLNPIKLCVGYKVDGKILKDFPVSRTLQSRIEPIFKTFKGFSGDLRQFKTYAKFPKEAKAFVAAIEKEVGAKCALVSLGKSREETLVLDKNFPWLK